MKKVEKLGIIPARYGSTRFPGKPLAMIGGKTMIERVYLQAEASNLDRVIVATDDDRIADVVQAFGGSFIMTDSDLASGTDRCREALEHIDEQPELVVNIQGDEPFIDPAQINLVLEILMRPEVGIATLVSEALNAEEVGNPNRVKAVLDVNLKALYFSRWPVPYDRSGATSHKDYFIHLGIYGFKADVLLELGKLKQGHLEKIESLEQLRWLENGHGIYAGITQERADAVDTPEDLKAIEKKYFL